MRAFARNNRVEAGHESELPVMIPADFKRQRLPLAVKTGVQIRLAGRFQMLKRDIVILALGGPQSAHRESTNDTCRPNSNGLWQEPWPSVRLRNGSAFRVRVRHRCPDVPASEPRSLKNPSSSRSTPLNRFACSRAASIASRMPTPDVFCGILNAECRFRSPWSVSSVDNPPLLSCAQSIFSFSRIGNLSRNFLFALSGGSCPLIDCSCVVWIGRRSNIDNGCRCLSTCGRG